MKNNAFTLVELIVVVTILAILATIGFVSYSGYLTGVRDTNRIASLTSISDGLELYRTKNDLPNPDDGIGVQVNGITIGRQGYVGANILQTIEYSKAGKDPKDDSYYSYYLTADKKYYQLMAFLEETENLETNSVITRSQAAVNYSNRYPKVYGKKLGILTDSSNAPIQEVITGNLNFTGGTMEHYIARFSDVIILDTVGSDLMNLKNLQSTRGLYGSCGDIFNKNKGLKGTEGNYLIYEKGELKTVMCDLTNGITKRYYRNFDGVDDYVAIPNITATGDFELEIEFIENDPGYATLIGFTDSRFTVSTTNVLRFDQAGSPFINSSVNAVTDNQLHKTKLTREGNRVSMFLDGKLLGTINSSTFAGDIIADNIGRDRSGIGGTDYAVAKILNVNFKSGWTFDGGENPYYSLGDSNDFAINNNAIYGPNLWNLGDVSVDLSTHDINTAKHSISSVNAGDVYRIKGINKTGKQMKSWIGALPYRISDFGTGSFDVLLEASAGSEVALRSAFGQTPVNGDVTNISVNKIPGSGKYYNFAPSSILETLK